jgi:hypothetical protein
VELLPEADIVMNAFERIVTATQGGLYESNYLKANSPDGQHGFWIKHNTLRPLSGEGMGEFWFVWFTRGKEPIVAKREVSWSSLSLASDRIALSAGDIRLAHDEAAGSLADIRWSLVLTGGLAPLWHLPYGALYRGGFPKKKMLTPAPNLRFRGGISVGDVEHKIEDWVGIRGHNWGSEHAHTYAYGNCNLWDDGCERAVDGFSAKIILGGRPTPWLSAAVGHAPFYRRNRLRHWLVQPDVVNERAWRLDQRSRFRGAGGCLSFHTDPATYAGLRYQHPDGRESYCYNSKFADVSWEVGGQVHTSRCGEYEVLFPEPLAGIPLHPTPGWTQAAGDYRSA